MSKNPLLNALAALLYITLVASFMFYGSKFANPKDSIIAPIFALSLFTLSAAVMGYLFCYQPAQLYFDNKRKEGVKLFLQTVGIFGGLTALLCVLLFVS